MEEKDNKQDQTSAGDPKGNVMDVQPPRPQQYASGAPIVDAQPEEPATETPAEEASDVSSEAFLTSVASSFTEVSEDSSAEGVAKEEASSPDTSAGEGSTAAPAETTPAAEGEAAAPEKPRPGLSAELLAQAEKETKKSDQDKDKHELLAAHASHKSRGPLVAVIIAVVIAIALAGVAVYAYMQSRDDKAQDSSNTSDQEASPATTQPASAKDVEDAAKDLDETINATNEAEEIPGEGLSEDSVGL